MTDDNSIDSEETRDALDTIQEINAAGRKRGVIYFRRAYDLAWILVVTGLIAGGTIFLLSECERRHYKKMTKACFDEIIHAPKRLQICPFLIPLQDAEFQVIRDELDVSDSVLSKHLKQLDAAGYVKFRKGAANNCRLGEQSNRE